MKYPLWIVYRVSQKSECLYRITQLANVSKFQDRSKDPRSQNQWPLRTPEPPSGAPRNFQMLEIALEGMHVRMDGWIRGNVISLESFRPRKPRRDSLGCNTASEEAHGSRCTVLSNTVAAGKPMLLGKQFLSSLAHIPAVPRTFLRGCPVRTALTLSPV